MAVTVIVRAKLQDPATAQALHDQVTAATKDAAMAAGDVSHKTYLDPTDPKAFLGIDVWRTAEAFQAFAADPRIGEFFGQLFDGSPEVTAWTDSGWNSW